jgi:hypothetical protein
MKKNSNRFDRNRKKKVPIFKKDLEFEIFHAQNLDEMEKDRLNFQKEYCKRVTKKLTISKNNKVTLLKKMIFDNNNENFRLEGLNKLDRQEEITLENSVLLYLMKNYQLIPVEDDNNKELDVIYQTSYFKYTNPHTFDEKIGVLYKNLDKEGYIDCSKPTFRSVFSENNNFSKVNWIKSQSSFQFFIRQLVKKEKVNCKDLWKKAAACFLINGEEKTNKQLGKVEEPSSNDALLIRECIKDFQ